MKFAVVAELVAIALSGALIFATGVKAEPSSRECWSMASSVKAALDSHPNASDQARAEYQEGSNACSKGYTKLGIAHLQAAMKAIGG